MYVKIQLMLFVRACTFTDVDEGYGLKVTYRNCEEDESSVKRLQLGL